MIRFIYITTVLAFCLCGTSSWAFTPTVGVGYRLETASDGLLVSTNTQASKKSPNCWAYAGDGSMTWFFTPDGTGTNYQIISQAGNRALGCNSGDAVVYLQSPTNSNGQLWYFADRTNGYTVAYNKLNKNALTVLNPFTTWYQAPHQTLTTTNYSSASNQLWWIAPVRLYPVQIIAVPPGYTCAATKRIVLCASNNLGASVTGTLSNNVSGAWTNLTFKFGLNLWNQYYYSNIDTTFATAAGSYTVTVSNFPPATFVVNDNFYRATTNGAGGQCGIPDLLSGFFAYQREKDPATGWENYSNYWDNVSNVVVTVDLGPANRDAHGGWNDATSNDKETFNESGALRNLAYAAEDAVNNSDRTNLLGEVTWGAQYLLRIQNADGTFPCSLGPDGMGGGTAPGILVNVDCGIVAQAATALAAASRVLAAYNPTLSSNCLSAAILSWGWVSNNYTDGRNYITNSALYQRSRDWVGSVDNVLGAAIELAVTTGDPVYQSAATNLFYAGQFVKGNYSWGETSFWVKKTGAYPVQNSGYHAAFSLGRYCRQPQVYGQLKADIGAQLNICFTNITRYINTPFGIDSGNFVNFGGESAPLAIKGYVSLNCGMDLGDDRMMMTARDYMNWDYGANPFGSSFICGFGNLNVLSMYARPRSGSIGEIIPGPQASGGILTTWNTNTTSSWSYGEGTVFNTTLMPAYIALMDRQVATEAAGFTVDITKPASQESFAAGVPFALQVSVANSNNTVSQVAYYQNGSLIGTATSAPFSFTWTNPVPGNLELDAIATDSAGLILPSTPVPITVTNRWPIANPDSYTVVENSTNILNPLANDQLLAVGGSLSLVSVSATNGTATISGTNVLFSPAPSFVGTATIGYVITDNVGGTSQSLITLDVVATGLTQVIYTNSTTWVCPPGVVSAEVYCWGAGGGSGGSTITTSGTVGAGGGGGGAFAADTNVAVTAGTRYTVTVGAGGVGGAKGVAGNAGAGGPSYFCTATITNVYADGGDGGTNAFGSAGGGGVGGNSGSCIGSIIFSGGNGSNGGGSAGGGGGSAGGGGNGGNGAITAGGTAGPAGNGLPGGVAGSNGASGAGPGSAGNLPGGGAGGAKANTTTAGIGGIGGGGQLVLVYTVPPANGVQFQSNAQSLSSPVNTSSALPVNGAQIKLNCLGNQLSLQWPTNCLGWLLQSNSLNPLNSADWFDVPNSQVGTNLTVTVSPNQPNVFYRLRKP